MRLTELVHHTLISHLRIGDLVIDATAGNGYDTNFLAERVGVCGKVIAIDIQDTAIQSTRCKLSKEALLDRVSLRVGDHSMVLETLIEEYEESISAIIFNLGYLPGSDKTIKTEAKNTIQALEAASKLLSPRGLLCVTAYQGHIGGKEEASTIEDWMSSNKFDGWYITHHVPDSGKLPPILWIASKP